MDRIPHEQSYHFIQIGETHFRVSVQRITPPKCHWNSWFSVRSSQFCRFQVSILITLCDFTDDSQESQIISNWFLDFKRFPRSNKTWKLKTRLLTETLKFRNWNRKYSNLLFCTNLLFLSTSCTYHMTSHDEPLTFPAARDQVFRRGDPGGSTEHRPEQGEGADLEIWGVLRSVPACFPSSQCWTH